MILAHLIWTASDVAAEISNLKSAISALESQVESFEKSSGCWEKVLPVVTALVVIGLILDVFAIVWQRKEDLHEWFLKFVWPKWQVWPVERPAFGIYVLEIVGTILIFVGCGGELWAGAELAYLNGQMRITGQELRSKSDRLVELAVETSGDAATNATIARQESDAAKRDATQVGHELKKAKETMAEVAALEAQLEERNFILTAEVWA